MNLFDVLFDDIHHKEELGDFLAEVLGDLEERPAIAKGKAEVYEMLKRIKGVSVNEAELIIINHAYTLAKAAYSKGYIDGNRNA